MPPSIDAKVNALTSTIISAAMSVYSSLGSGLREDVYEKALFTALEERGLAVQQRARIELGQLIENCQDTLPPAYFYLDLLVENQVVIEVKARPRLVPNNDIAQVSICLTAAQKPVGLLFNFGRSSLYFKRIFRPKNEDRPVLSRV